ncbi:MAG: hypothetical protein IPJ65_12205 [Archangiaceae bacterium]|nr:hypothetical protein [Archangiaceae bacterium]
MALAPRIASWRPAAGLMLAALLLSGLLLYFKLKLYPRPILESDTQLLVGGAAQLDACLRSGARPCNGVWHFPLLQYVEAVALYRLGDTANDVLLWFTWFSGLALVGSMVGGAAFLFARGLRGAAAFLVVALFSSFAVTHFNDTYGETASAFVTLLFVIACWWRRSALLVLAAAFVATITKETAAPFLLLIGAVPLLLAEGTWPARLKADARVLAALVLGVGLGLGANAWLNVLRFGAVTNTYLLEPVLTVHSNVQNAVFLAGLWVSPNGGMLVFAPLATLALIACAVLGFRAEKTWSRRLASLTPAGLMFLLTVGFGRWWAPFGWWTWGPRLCLPWLAPLLLLALLIDGARLEAWLRRALGRLPVAAGLAALVLVAASPHLTAIGDSDSFYGFFLGNEDCLQINSIDIRKNPELYYPCLNQLIFPKRDFAIARTLGHSASRFAAPLAMYLGLLALLLFWLRREVLAVKQV